MLLYDTLLSIGFQKIHANHSVFMKWLGKGIISIYILIYINDILILTPSKEAITTFITELSKYFNLTNKGLVTKYLGIKVIRKGSLIRLSQKKFITIMLY